MAVNTARLNFIFSNVSERWTQRLEMARARYREILDLELKRLKDLELESRPQSQAQNQRMPDGFLTDEEQSVAIPLYAGGNLFEGLELRLKGGSVYSGPQVYSSNDHIEAGGRRYLLKVLPAVYRSTGDRS